MTDAWKLDPCLRCGHKWLRLLVVTEPHLNCPVCWTKEEWQERYYENTKVSRPGT